jgi:hypothetical protein
MKRAGVLIIVLLSFIRTGAQPGKSTDNINYLQLGFKAGTGYSNITDLSKVLVSESYYTGYTFENNSKPGFTGGLYVNYRFQNSISAMYFEISYSMLGNNLHYSDVDGFEYDFAIKYNYINLNFWYKAYLYNGFYLGIGPRLGLNVTPGALFYTSNGEDQFGPDIRIQQQMRDVLKGRTDFCLGVGTGYEFPFGLSIDLRYYHGISDVMETEVNNFHFIENKNTSRIIQFTIGYALPFDLSDF